MTATEQPANQEVHEASEGHHPTAGDYVRIALVLAVLTAMEVSASFIEVGPAFIPLLTILMAIKFVLVAGWFMHLKYDTNLYSRLLATGLFLALGVYAAVLIFFAIMPGTSST